jgi:Icc protein
MKNYSREVISFLHKSKNILSLLILCLLLLSSCTSNQPGFRFIFMTDIHVQPEQQAAQGFQTAIQRANELRPDFVLTGGDLIMDALEQSYERSTELYDLYLRLIRNFNMPVYNTIGNHEVFGLYVESGIDPSHPEYGKAMYKHRMNYPQTYYSFDHKGWHFIVLDAIGFRPDRHYFGCVDEIQLHWLEQDLSQVNKSTPIAVSLHIPLTSVYVQMSKGSTIPLDSGTVVVNAKEVLEKFSGYNLRLVLQGHLHIVEEIIYRDTHFITGGAVSAYWWRGPRDGFEEGFLVIDVRGNNFSWRYEDFGWTVGDKD